MERHDQGALDKALAEIDRNISIGNWEQAQFRAKLHALNPIVKWSAHVWFRVALAELLHGGNMVIANRAWLEAKRREDYSLEIEGDFHREMAIAYCKRDEYELAWKEIDQAGLCHQGDINRMICLTGVRGRVFLRQGKYDLAYEHARQAYEQWKAMGDLANQQWMTNNLLPLLVAATMVDKRTEGCDLVVQILERDENLTRCYAALCINATTSVDRCKEIIRLF